MTNANAFINNFYSLLLRGASKEFITFAGLTNAIIIIAMFVITIMQSALSRLFNLFEKIIDACLSSKLPNSRFSSYSPPKTIHIIITIGCLLIACLFIIGKFLK